MRFGIYVKAAGTAAIRIATAPVAQTVDKVLALICQLIVTVKEKVRIIMGRIITC